MVEIESISSPHNSMRIRLVLVTRINLDDVAAHTKSAALKVDVGSFVLQLDQSLQQTFRATCVRPVRERANAVISVRIAEAVDTRDTRDHDHVATFKQRPRRRHSQAIDLLVNDRFFFDVDVGGRNVSFGLIVVVIGDEVFDRVLGKERAELLIKLRRECLVVCEHERGALRAFDDAGDRERLAAAGDAEQHLIFGAVVQPFDERLDRRAADRLLVGIPNEV